MAVGEAGERSYRVRALECSCGKHLEADNDEELFQRAREHVDMDHSEMQLSDEKVRHIVEQGSYEK
jgi:predicted small metal-binding protein